MDYTKPEFRKGEGPKPPISANFAPPPTEQRAIDEPVELSSDEAVSGDGRKKQD